MEIAILLLIGILTGVVTGLTGASGVMVVVPLVHIFLKLSIHTAIGTSLMVDVLSALAISYTFYKNKNINLTSALYVAIGTIGAAQIGSYFADQVPERGLGSSFGGFLIILSVMCWRSAAKEKNQEEGEEKLPVFLRKPIYRNTIAFVLASASGFMTGFMGAGGGTNLLLILLFVCRFPLHQALGTSILLMALTALSGVVGHASLGNVVWEQGLIIAGSAMITGVLCANKASSFSEKLLGRTMSVIYCILGLVMLSLNLLESNHIISQ